ncbi:MAG: hypothetical protein DME03_05540 [Candidatus Rokuibacteriota bacterium]|nr:MAG: hypothetical protein DME03_05540 [Candidatus Rokubacteria bacterium]
MQDSERSLLIVVPRTGQEAGRSLLQVFGEDPAVQVVVDRRFNDRRVRSGAFRPERRHGERRHRLDADSELRVDRWIAIPRASSQIDLGDPDAKAILFLCCSQHAVPCQRCQDTYRIGWISRSDTALFSCPLCGSDLTAVVAAHAQTCVYWASRVSSAKKPRTRVSVEEPSARAATG